MDLENNRTALIDGNQIKSIIYQTMDRWSVDTQVLGTAVTWIESHYLVVGLC